VGRQGGKSEGVAARLNAYAHSLDNVRQRIYRITLMSSRKRYSFWIDDAQAEGLKAVKERDGVLESEQIRRAIDAWLREKGVMKADRKRVSARKRS
jgi:hypothetical protein